MNTARSERLHRAILALAFACIGCGAREGFDRPGERETPLTLGLRYVEEAAFRRDELVRSLVNPENGYSRLRIERYTEEIWGALPEWNPRVVFVRPGTAAAPPPEDASWAALEIDDVPWDEPALVELGRQAFFGYPVQLAAYVRHALASPDEPSRYGLWVDGERLGATVWTELPRGLVEPAVTCATCHASQEGRRVVAGKNNADFDIGALSADYLGGAPSGWGPGRTDVTPDDIDNPTAITDLRAVRSQVQLHRAATIENGLIPLAIRTETLVTTSLDESVRPPRKLAFAIALYLWQLEPEPVRDPDAASRRGEALFGSHCARCHTPPDFSGPPVPLDEVGTPAAVGMSPDRFTGFYRVPSLRGVGDRKRLFSGGDAVDVADVLRADRAAPGHPFGLELLPEEKRELIQYLETL